MDYLQPGTPDRWKQAAAAKGAKSTPPWTSAQARVKAQTAYRCGAVLEDPAAKVSFRFQTARNKEGKYGPAVVVPLELGGKL